MGCEQSTVMQSDPYFMLSLLLEDVPEIDIRYSMFTRGLRFQSTVFRFRDRHDSMLSYDIRCVSFFVQREIFLAGPEYCDVS